MSDFPWAVCSPCCWDAGIAQQMQLWDGSGHSA